MPTKRQILLTELDGWRREGVLDDATHALLRSRYEHAPASDALDRELGAPTVASSFPSSRAGPADPAAGPAGHGTHAGGDAHERAGRGERRSFAADSMQFVGGLLLGAGLVALVVFLDIASASAPYVLLLLGALLLVPAMVGALRGAPTGLVEAGLAGGLVPMLVAVGISLEAEASQLIVPLLVALLAVAIIVLRKGEGPTTLVAGGGYTWATAAATLLREDIFFGEPQMAQRWTWFLALLALGALLATWRRKLWTEASLGALVAPATLAFAMLLEPMELTALGMELAIAAWLAPLLAVGIYAGSKGLVTGAAAGLTIDAVAFAFEVGGPGTAVVVLLALGGLLVWQAETVRRYFRRTQGH